MPTPSGIIDDNIETIAARIEFELDRVGALVKIPHRVDPFTNVIEFSPRNRAAIITTLRWILRSPEYKPLAEAMLAEYQSQIEDRKEKCHEDMVREFASGEGL